MIDINELRKLTQAATPGPWKILPVGDGRQKFAVADRKSLSILTVTDEGRATFGTVYDDADAEFIAAANPTTISELLDRLEAAEKEIALKERVIDALGSELNTVANERDTLHTALEKIADWDSAWGPYPETNEAWRAMVIVTAREAVPRRGEKK